MKRRLFLLLGTVLLMEGTRAAHADPLSDDEAVVARQIKRLKDRRNAVRAEAAAIIRRVVAKYPSGTSNLREADAGEARWEQMLRQIQPGMTPKDVLKRLPEAVPMNLIGSMSEANVSYRLDAHWLMSIWYAKGKVSEVNLANLARYEEEISVEAPKDYTGIWTCWYKNGQKLFDIQYTNGKYNGTYTSFRDDGQKQTEQHYTNHVADGSDTGWHSNGKLAYQGQYKSDKRDGTWTHWYENGHTQSEEAYNNGENDGPEIRWYENGLKQSQCTYKAGKRHGLCTTWYPNGQKQSETEYVNGLMEGRDAEWDETGKLRYAFNYKNGEVITD